MTATGDTATSKLELIMGRDGLARLADSTVMVLGVGGVGSNCVEALARGGVGRLIVVDHDVVQASNINRQAIAFRSTIGRKKVDVARAMIADINPEDIESISVLTGAAAAALYGSDAANGAIDVTTKKGQAGQLSVTATAGVEIMTPFVLATLIGQPYYADQRGQLQLG